ncbi:MAG: DUF3343 domain-containing protein [Candidatus Cloacimonetes bacterium]|nr:DUF3343 domain-containing protein [Candidatus Cloacimonadota bacterium]
MMQIVVTFKSTHQAMKAKKAVLKDKLQAELIPTPREISKECGFSLLIHDTTDQIVREYMYTNELIFSHIYNRTEKEGKISYEENN